MRSKYSDSRRCAAAFIRFAMDRFDHNHRGGAIACWNYFINDRKVSGFWTPKDDAVVLGQLVVGIAARRRLSPTWRYPMADDLTNRGPSDRSKVNVHEDWEVRWWCGKWNVTRAQLVAAVNAVGTSAKKVAEHLGKPYPV